METEHKEGCWYPKAIAEEERYYKDWPNACNRCDGWGGWGGFDFYEDDTGYSDFDPCPECLEEGRCPRCGGAVIAEAYWDAGHFTNCDHCSYVEGRTSGCSFTEEPCACIEPWPGYPDGDYFADVPY